MISAGHLDRTITVQRFGAGTPNALNETISVWQDHIKVRAMRRDVSDGERMAAGQVGSFLMTRFTVRSSISTRGLTPRDRIVHDGGTWSIHGIKEASEGRKRFLEITAAKDAD